MENSQSSQSPRTSAIPPELLSHNEPECIVLCSLYFGHNDIRIVWLLMKSILVSTDDTDVTHDCDQDNYKHDQNNESISLQEFFSDNVISVILERIYEMVVVNQQGLKYINECLK